MEANTIHTGDARELATQLPDESVHCIVTSPPYYGLRDYGVDGQIGLEASVDEYVDALVGLFRELRRALRHDGTVWLNLGSSYASGGMNPNRSRPEKHVPAYGNDDKESQDFQGADHVCPDSYGEYRDETQSHHAHSAHSDQSASLDERQILLKDRDSELPDYAQAFLDAWLRDVRESTISSFVENDWDAFSLAAKALVSRLMLHSTSDDVPLSADMLACISDIVGTLQTSDHHKLGRALSFLASNNLLSGMDGLTWSNCSIPPLKFKAKDRMMIPHLVALALQADGWYVRSEIVWHKKSPMPSSVTDRPTDSHEFVFLLAKSPRYFYDADAVREPAEYGFSPTTGNMFARVGNSAKQPERTISTTSEGDGGSRNLRNVWTLGPEPYAAAHFATFPRALVRPCILAGTSAHGVCPVCGAPWVRVVERTTMKIEHSNNHPPELRTRTSGTMVSPPTSETTGWQPTCTCDASDPVPATVLDPFMGSGTVAQVAIETGRNWLGFELNPEYMQLAYDRINGAQPALLAWGA